MAKFKKGDTVEYISEYARKSCSSKAREIVSVRDGGYFFEDGNWIQIQSGDEEDGKFELRLVKAHKENKTPIKPSTPTKEKTVSEKATSWSFNTIAPNFDVDLEVISKDLSRANPIALIAMDTEKGWRGAVLIHRSLAHKALAINDVAILSTQDAFGGHAIAIVDKAQEFKTWVEWAKEIKKAEWPKEDQNKGKVTVSLPTI